MTYYGEITGSINPEEEITGQVDSEKEIIGSIQETFLKGLSAYEIAVKNGYSGTEEEWLTSLKGEQGIQGIQGEQGIQGVKGDTGAIGPTGPQGPKGDKGDTGERGIQGIQGIRGETGAVGPQGPKGDKGETGPKGDPGNDYVLTQADKEEIAGMVDIPDVPVTDVQVNGTSVLENGVANIPVAGPSTRGVIYTNADHGLSVTSGGMLSIYKALEKDCKNGANNFHPITPVFQHFAIFYGLAKVAGHDERESTLPVGTYTEEAKSAISEMLGGSVAVSGTSPTINAKAGVRYVCGEVSALDITLPTSGIVDVVFTSGSTPTALTINGSVRWANGFDPENLDADTTYEINIMDGLGVAASWT